MAISQWARGDASPTGASLMRLLLVLANEDLVSWRESVSHERLSLNGNSLDAGNQLALNLKWR